MNDASAAFYTITISILIFAILVYSIVDRILDYKENIKYSFPSADPEPAPEPPALDKTDKP